MTSIIIRSSRSHRLARANDDFAWLGRGFEAASQSRLVMMSAMILSAQLMLGCQDEQPAAAVVPEVWQLSWQLGHDEEIMRLITDHSAIVIDYQADSSRPGQLTLYCGTQSHEDGYWQLLAAELGIGRHQVSARFTADDGEERLGPVSTIIIRPNLPPTVEINRVHPRYVRDVSPQNILVEITATDPEQHSLNYQLEHDGTIIATSETTTLPFDSRNMSAGDHTLRAIVSDGHHSISSAPVTFTIDQNDPPVFDRVPADLAPVSYLVPAIIALDYGALDSEGDDIVYTLQLDGRAVSTNRTGSFTVSTPIDREVALNYTCVADDGHATTTSTKLVVRTIDPTTMPVEVPDHTGLGERLALREWLQANGQTIPAAADLRKLRRLYLAATIPDYTLRREALIQRRDELRRILRQRYRHKVDDNASIAELVRALQFYQRQDATSE